MSETLLVLFISVVGVGLIAIGWAFNALKGRI